MGRVKFDRDCQGGTEALVWGIVVSTIEMDQNWNYLHPIKAVHIFKTIFQSGISNTWIYKVRDVLH